jgi:purine-binding chemotaxis protein CheW
MRRKKALGGGETCEREGDVDSICVDKSTMQTAQHQVRYLIFRLGAETFRVDVMQVREVTGVQSITAIPHAPREIRGVINLRGKVVPVADLRMKLSGAEAEPTAKSSLIVMRTRQSEDEMTMALVVDEVFEVATINDARVFDADDVFRDRGNDDH